MPVQPFDMLDHRPWPLPPRPWVMWMDWDHLAFLHWRVPAAFIQATLPPGLQLDLFDGEAWLGIVPFEMRHVRPRGIPSLPWVSFFPELNVRTYVTYQNKPGVFFWSLDAANPLAVAFARRWFHLPYFNARMRCANDGNTTDYVSLRTHRKAYPARFQARYRATSAPYRSQPATLEHWLTERYCYYTTNPRGELLRCDVHHHPWPLQAADVEINHMTLAKDFGVELLGPPLAHVVQHLRVVGWLPENLGVAQ